MVWLLTMSAVMHGLAKRLAPHRRVIFFFAQIVFFVALFSFNGRSPRHFVALAFAFIGMTFLLALELIVGFLQAFVFAALACVYLNDVVNLGHGH